MGPSFANNSTNFKMKGYAENSNFYEGKVDVEDPMLTTCDMKITIQVILITSEVIRDHNNIHASNLVFIIISQVFNFS